MSPNKTVWLLMLLDDADWCCWLTTWEYSKKVKATIWRVWQWDSTKSKSAMSFCTGTRNQLLRRSTTLSRWMRDILWEKKRWWNQQCLMLRSFWPCFRDLQYLHPISYCWTDSLTWTASFCRVKIISVPFLPTKCTTERIQCSILLWKYSMTQLLSILYRSVYN